MGLCPRQGNVNRGGSVMSLQRMLQRQLAVSRVSQRDRIGRPPLQSFIPQALPLPLPFIFICSSLILLLYHASDTKEGY